MTSREGNHYASRIARARDEIDAIYARAMADDRTYPREVRSRCYSILEKLIALEDFMRTGESDK